MPAVSPRPRGCVDSLCPSSLGFHGFSEKAEGVRGGKMVSICWVAGSSCLVLPAGFVGAGSVCSELPACLSLSQVLFCPKALAG